MVDHPTDPEGIDAVDAVSAGQVDETSTGDKTVPLNELVKHRQRASEAEARVEELQRQIEEMNSQVDTPDSEQPQPTESHSWEDRLARMERQESMRNLMSEQGLDHKQAEAVHGIMSDMPGLNPAEARMIAAQRDGELFAEGAAAGYDPATHGSSRPTPGAMPAEPQQSDYQQRLDMAGEMIASGRDKKTANKLLNNLVGRIAAQQVGKSGHEMIPLPRKQQ
jgi:TolA-binding protein